MIQGAAEASGGSAATGGTGGGGARTVAETQLIGTLTPYSPGGGDLFPSGSVQAHWYQWDGVYVVLYRGYDATDAMEICPGNSIETQTGFGNITNSPYPASAAAICAGAPTIVDNAAGCGSLLYYVTESPTTNIGNLWGTIEISASSGFEGQTTQGGTPTISPITDVPEFEPGPTAYNLPTSTVDPSGVVTCAL